MKSGGPAQTVCDDGMSFQWSLDFDSCLDLPGIECRRRYQRPGGLCRGIPRCNGR